ncbi:hypothetical protein [Luteibacter yeojuensis]
MNPGISSFRRLFAVLCVVWLVLNFNVLFGGRVLPWDALDQFYPTVYFNAHSLRAGLAPWWNPYIYSGYPQIGDPQGMMFSPLLMAWMLLPADPGAVWFAWGVLLHVLMGGAAMLGILRRYGGNALGPLLGATVFMAGGVAASRLEHVPDVIAYAYVPVVILALRHFLVSPGWRRGVLLGLAAGAMVTQLVQITYLFVLVIVAQAAIATGRCWRDYAPAQRRRWFVGMFLAIVVASVLGLPQLVFSWAAMSVSNRIDLPLSAAAAGSLDFRAFLFLLDPNAFDGLRHLSKAPLDVVSAFLYIGTLPLLALWGLPRAWSTSDLRPALASSGVLVLLAVVYMLGTSTPIYGWLYSWLPGLVHFRRPADAAYLFNFAMAVISGIAASRIHLGSRREPVLLLAGAVLWLGLVCLSMRDRHATVFLAAAVAGAALWQLRRPGTPWRAALWFMAVLVADYRSFNLNGTFNETGNGAARFVKSPAAVYLAQNLGQEREALPHRISTVDTRTTWDNSASLLGISSTRGYNPLRYALYEKWYRPRESSNGPDEMSPYNGPPGNRLDDLLSVRYLVVGHRADRPAFSPPEGYSIVQSTKDVDIWRNDGAYPRLLNPRSAMLLGAAVVPDVGQFARTDFSRVLWLTPRDDEDFAAAGAALGSCNGAATTEVVSVTPTRTDLRVTSTSDAWIAIGDLDYPGWEADLDGRPIPIYRANGMFRAVCTPAGEHRLRFHFDPGALVAYAWRHHR